MSCHSLTGACKYPVHHGGDCVICCRDFWNAKDSWYPTWAADVDNGEQAAMAIDYVRVYQDSN